jgi:hypothetical protein
MPQLETLLERLIAGRVQFVVVGGFAAVAHGVTLITEDIDICCPFTVANLLRLQRALDGLHPVHRMTPQRLPLVLSRANCDRFKNLYLDTDLGQLDCLSKVKGLGGYATVSHLSVKLNLASGACRVLRITPLIRAKLAMGRPRDLQAVAQLKAIKERRGKI